MSDAARLAAEGPHAAAAVRRARGTRAARPGRAGRPDVSAGACRAGAHVVGAGLRLAGACVRGACVRTVVEPVARRSPAGRGHLPRDGETSGQRPSASGRRWPRPSPTTSSSALRLAERAGLVGRADGRARHARSLPQAVSIRRRPSARPHRGRSRRSVVRFQAHGGRVGTRRGGGANGRAPSCCSPTRSCARGRRRCARATATRPSPCSSRRARSTKTPATARAWRGR